MISADCEEDHLHDVYEHEREHERGRDDVRREPKLQELMQVYERVNAAERDGRLDRFEEQGARVRVERTRLRLILLARRREKFRQLLALDVLAQKVSERENLAAHLPLYEVAQRVAPALAYLRERLGQLGSARLQVFDQ